MPARRAECGHGVSIQGRSMIDRSAGNCTRHLLPAAFIVALQLLAPQECLGRYAAADFDRRKNTSKFPSSSTTRSSHLPACLPTALPKAGLGRTRLTPTPPRNGAPIQNPFVACSGPMTGLTTCARWSAAMSASCAATARSKAAPIRTRKSTPSYGTLRRGSASVSVRSSPRRPMTGRPWQLWRARPSLPSPPPSSPTASTAMATTIRRLPS